MRRQNELSKNVSRATARANCVDGRTAQKQALAKSLDLTKAAKRSKILRETGHKARKDYSSCEETHKAEI
jgi:hypothetical protein